MSLIGENLSFGYNKNSILFENLDIEIKKDEIIGLRGYSGYGKTTLGKVLAGYLPMRTGRIYVNEKLQNDKLKFNPVQMIHQHPEKSINPRWKIHKVLEESDIEKEFIMEKFGISHDWLNRWPCLLYTSRCV